MKPYLFLLFLACSINFTQAQPFKFWRIVVTECNNLKITELNFITPTGELPSCNMRSNVDCTVRAIGTNQEEAFKPFDGFFVGNNGLFIGNLATNSSYFVGLNFQANPQMVSALRFQKDSFNDITSFKIESSNDNISWKTHRTFSGLSGTWTDTVFVIDNVKPSTPANIRITDLKEITLPNPLPLPKQPNKKKFEVRVDFDVATDNKGIFQYQIFNNQTGELIKTLPFQTQDLVKKLKNQFFTAQIEEGSGLAAKIVTQDIYGNISEKLVGIGKPNTFINLPQILILPLPN